MRTRFVELAGMSACAALLLASCATAALGKQALQLNDAHAPASTATVAIQANTASRCFEEQHGSVVSNGKPTDKLSFEAPFANGCEHVGDVPLAGAATGATINSLGALKLKMSPKLAVTTEGCRYEFSKLALHVEIPGGGLQATGNSTGKLNKALSTSGCATKSVISFSVVIYGPSNHDLETELVG
jgi:hypothetical protein